MSSFIAAALAIHYSANRQLDYLCLVFGTVTPKRNQTPVADLGGGGGGVPGAGAPPLLFLHHFIFLLTNLLPLRCNSWPGLLSSQYRALPETERLGNETTI